MPESKENSSSPQKKGAGEGSFPIVAIGASAGGLESLEAFFDNMPSDTGTAFVIVQHISPEGKSMLGEILKKHTRMAVLQVQEGMRPEPDCVYFNPPGRDVTLTRSGFQLEEQTVVRGMKLPIDHFFRSLALELGEKAICIILSGTGSDGTLGLKAIKEEAGMVMVQEIEQARYGGMPESALSTGLVDYVLPVEKMPEVLLTYIKHPFLQAPGRTEAKERQFTGYIQKILALVHSEVGSDFSDYKSKTIRRRVERRMALHEIEAISDYHRFLLKNPTEVKLLFHELLIGVTQFFRDPAAFEALQEKVIPKILEQKSEGSPIRIWVAGCSTGEEALSLAMVFSETMARMNKYFSMQIYATDLDPDAIDRARKGEYSEAIVADVSEERLKRFFTRKEGHYRVKTELREMIVYAPQNLVSDPPFSRLDLISCRNVLIYMETTLQKKIIPVFHFTLNPDGYLFLGSSESAGSFSTLFSVIDSKWKIFKVKKDLTSMKAPGFALPEGLTCDFGTMKEKIGRKSAEQAMDRLIVRDYAPASVLITEKFEALYFRGPVGRYFEIQPGQASLNLLKIARPGISLKLTSALREAITKKVTVTVPKVKVKLDGQFRSVNITIRRLAETGDGSDLLVLVFEEVLPAEPVRRGKRSSSPDGEADPRVLELESELQGTRENLQSTIEELEAANEELKSSNEELQSTNEEMQSTNEELATAREELQSTNEELLTVNSELNNKVEEFTEVNNDITNLFSSTEIGTIFLDNDLRIKRFTPAIKRIFSLISTDIGRPLRDITSKITLGTVMDDVSEVLETLHTCDKEVEAAGKWFSMRILPYRTMDNQIAGIVMSFVDITELKRTERMMSKAKEYAENIVNTVREPLLILDAELRAASANSSFYRFFMTNQEETVGKLVYDLGNGQWNIPDLRRLLEEILPRNSSFEDFEMEHRFQSIGHKKMLLNAKRMEQESGESEFILLAMEDVTKS
jgi:two-component system CheB/CheR fusion protein